MRTCPDCGTQYEPHVEVCLIDGADLRNVVSKPLAITGAHTLDEFMSPPASQQHTEEASPPVVVPLPVQEPKQNKSLIGLLIALFLFFSVVLIVLVWFLFIKPAPIQVPTPPPVIELPKSKPVNVAPKPVEAVPVPAKLDSQIVLTSVPSGAKVLENGKEVCPATPCRVPHSESQSLPRTFRIELKGHKAQSIEISNVKDLVSVQLKATSKPRPSRPRARPPKPVEAPKAPKGKLLQDR